MANFDFTKLFSNICYDSQFTFCDFRDKSNLFVNKANMYNIKSKDIDEFSYFNSKGEYSICILKDEPFLVINKQLLNYSWFKLNGLSFNKYDLDKILKLQNEFKEIDEELNKIKKSNSPCDVIYFYSIGDHKFVSDDLNRKLDNLKRRFNSCFIELSLLLQKAKYYLNDEQKAANNKMLNLISKNDKMMKEII